MALDPHPDREPGMEARVLAHDDEETEYAKSVTGKWIGLGGYGENATAYTWAELADRHPDGTVVLP